MAAVAPRAVANTGPNMGPPPSSDGVPPEIKTIIDKTALYVARNGPEFEAMILKNNAENPKFSFLKPGDPFHAHYRKMVIYNGGAAAAAPPPAQSAGGDVAMADAGGAGGKGVIASSGQTAKPSTVGPRVVPLALPEQQYRVPRPAGLLPEEVETVMLAAQFTARNGRRFLAQLAEREGNNPRFDFLRPQHHLFGFFTALVDAYSKVLLPPQEVLDNLKANAMPDARPPLLSRLRQHAEWLLVEEKKRLDKQNADDAERMQQLSIDWHDFVVVETISFDDDDDEELPAAARLDPSAQPPAAQAAGARAQEPAAQPDGPQPAEPAELDLVDLGASVPEPAMVVRKDYKPQLQPQAKARAAAVEMAIDPISGKEVPLSQIGEHLRISLLDPRWKEQKQAAADKNKESNVASGSEVFKNIAAFAQRRTDIFGDEEGAIGELLERERREKEKAAKDRVIWDGTSESIVRAATLAQTQASAVSEQAEHEAEAPTGLANTGPGIGPSLAMPPPPPQQPPLPAGLPPAPPQPQPPMLPPMPGMPPPALPPVPPPFGAHPPAVPPPFAPPAGPPPPSRFGPVPPLPPGFGPPPPVGLPPPMPPPGFAPPGLPPMPGGPPGGGAGAGGDEQAAKRQRTDETRTLQPEEAFLQNAEHDREIRIVVTVPTDASKAEWRLEGQTVEVVLHVRETVSTLKDRLKESLGGMPPNKQQITGPGLPILKDKDTLAAYNLTDGEQLTLKVKVRGGR